MSENNNDKKESWDSFLTNEDEKEDGIGYVSPNIEFKLPKEKRQECRDIVMEIRKFGVSQRQLLYLVYLLSLELEDVNVMRSIAKAVGENRDNIPVSLSDVQAAIPKIIVAKE